MAQEMEAILEMEVVLATTDFHKVEMFIQSISLIVILALYKQSEDG